MPKDNGSQYMRLVATCTLIIDRGTPHELLQRTTRPRTRGQGGRQTPREHDLSFVLRSLGHTRGLSSRNEDTEYVNMCFWSVCSDKCAPEILSLRRATPNRRVHVWLGAALRTQRLRHTRNRTVMAENSHIGDSYTFQGSGAMAHSPRMC